MEAPQTTPTTYPIKRILNLSYMWFEQFLEKKMAAELGATVGLLGEQNPATVKVL